MQKLKRFFTETKMSWPLVIVLSLACGIVPGLLMIPGCLEGTSLRQPGISFEFWVFMGMFIALNCEKPLDAGLKVFVFFLISQPLIYLVQVPFSWLGWGLFSYYPLWAVITVLTFPAGMLVSLIRRDKWWGVLILLLPMAILAIELGQVPEVLSHFPKLLLMYVFIVAQLVLWPLVALRGKKKKAIAYVVAAVIFCGALAGYLLSSSSAISNGTPAEGQAPYTLLSESTDEATVTIENDCISVSYSSLEESKAFTVPIKYKDADGTVYTLTFTKGTDDFGGWSAISTE